ncbi:prephenate dehydrogenase [Candidatus Pacearchaeota archaeon]|nr:prephenate dehydrogenase [Candidatus Pacearchaeota archaeon]
MKQTVSVIGFGNFGKFLVKHLILSNIDVFVTDIIDKNNEARELGASFVSLEKALQSKIIIIAVPMEKFIETLINIKNELKKDTIIIDVCSLKMFSCDAMIRILPKNVQIIGSHPLFGPQSARNSIEGMKIALINVRTNKKTFEKIKKFCETLKLRVIITTPEIHDKEMAVSQALTHFIGMVFNRLGIKRIELSTKTFEDLMNIVDIVKNDTPALFNNMQQINPFAKKIREDFIKNVNSLDYELN